MAGKRENIFQADLIKELKDEFKGSIVTKLDSKHEPTSENAKIANIWKD